MLDLKKYNILLKQIYNILMVGKILKKDLQEWETMILFVASLKFALIRVQTDFKMVGFEWSFVLSFLFLPAEFKSIYKF